MGGVGCISVTANVVPEYCAAMHESFDDGDLETARAIEARLIALHIAMFASPSPAPAKYLLAKMGLCSDEVRLPITPCDSAAITQIEQAMEAVGLY